VAGSEDGGRGTWRLDVIVFVCAERKAKFLLRIAVFSSGRFSYTVSRISAGRSRKGKDIGAERGG
jgi:hypothetical protein